MPSPILARLLPCLCLVAPAAAQTTIRAVDGPGPGFGMGRAVLALPDVNADGDPDVMVGVLSEDGLSSGVIVVSGRFLRTGLLPAYLNLFTSTSSSSSNAPQHGSSFANLGALSLPGSVHIVVGSPGTNGNQAASGQLVLWRFSGGSALKGTPILSNLAERFGQALCSVGDVNGDGSDDLAVGAPYNSSGGSLSGKVYVLSGAQLAVGQRQDLMVFTGASAFEERGTSLASADFDGDGKLELIVGAPGWNQSAGRVLIYKGGTGVLWRTLTGVAGERLGSSLSAGVDVTGDGVVDLLVGAPLSDTAGVDAGRAVLVSGAKLVANQAPFETYVLAFGKVGEQLGSSVALAGDLNGDGRNDMLVGAPEYDGSAFTQNIGAVMAYSGESGALISLVLGTAGQRLGRSVAGLADYSSDGLADMGVGVPGADAGGTDAGQFQVVSLFPTKPFLYCTAKVNSLGCLSAIGSSGSPSASSPGPFQVTAANVLNNAPGLLFYGYAPAATPFLGATLCIGGSVKRTAGQSSQGSPPPGKDCSGHFDFAFNALIQGGGVPELVAGQEVFCQVWSRDPSGIGGSNTTNAVRFVINP